MTYIQMLHSYELSCAIYFSVITHQNYLEEGNGYCNLSINNLPGIKRLESFELLLNPPKLHATNTKNIHSSSGYKLSEVELVFCR